MLEATDTTTEDTENTEDADDTSLSDLANYPPGRFYNEDGIDDLASDIAGDFATTVSRLAPQADEEDIDVISVDLQVLLENILKAAVRDAVSEALDRLAERAESTKHAEGTEHAEETDKADCLAAPQNSRRA